jgi:hypothetical protein
MANVTSIQTLVDGQKNVVIKVDGYLDTSDVALATLLDPATLSAIDNEGHLATKLRIDKIVYDVEDTLAVNLFWDATADVSIWHLAGRGKLEFDRKYGGLQNNAGAGVTGKILYSTQGWAASGLLSYSFTLECTKQW